MIEKPLRTLCATLLAAAALLAAAGVAAQTAVADFRAGPGNGVYSFASWTPKTLPELMRGQGSAVERIIASQKLPDGLRFAAHMPVYSGGCVGVFRLRVKPGVFSKAPQQWLHGSADDYAGIAPCQAYAKEIAEAGTPVEFVVLEGAGHKFDADDPRRLFLRGAQRTLDTCPVEMDIDTLASYDRSTGQRLQGEAYQAVLKTCSAVGASIEGSSKARERAAQVTLAFLAKVFAR
jgi:pimeloyl-ACP methyl ester carboxylesterase